MTDAETNCECARRLGWTVVKKPHSDGSKILYFFLISPEGKQRGCAWTSEEGAWKQKPHGSPKIPNFHGSVDAVLSLVSKAREWGYDLLLDNSANMWTAKFWDCQREIDTYIEFVGESKDLASAAICAAFLQLPVPNITSPPPTVPAETSASNHA